MKTELIAKVWHLLSAYVLRSVRIKSDIAKSDSVQCAAEHFKAWNVAKSAKENVTMDILPGHKIIAALSYVFWNS